MFPEQRLQLLEKQYAHAVQNILVLQITDETLKVLFVLADGSTRLEDVMVEIGNLLTDKGAVQRR